MMRPVIILLIPLFLLTGCITPMGVTSSTTPLQDRTYKNLGKSEGKAFSWSLFGIWAMGKPKTDKAIGMAVKGKKGDALINVRWYERTWYFILFSLHELVVTGDVIRFIPDLESAGERLGRE
jgi:hypothetical protein